MFQVSLIYIACSWPPRIPEWGNSTKINMYNETYRTTRRLWWWWPLPFILEVQKPQWKWKFLGFGLAHAVAWGPVHACVLPCPALTLLSPLLAFSWGYWSLDLTLMAICLGYSHPYLLSLDVGFFSRQAVITESELSRVRMATRLTKVIWKKAFNTIPNYFY